MQPTASEALTLRTSEFTYPGAAEHIRAVRADLRPLLADCPVAEDVILCASELAANATLHSNSRLPGGTFTVRVAISACDHVRIEIEDNGGPWTQVPVTPSGTMGSTSSASWPLTGESTATRSLVPPGQDSTCQAAHNRAIRPSYPDCWRIAGAWVRSFFTIYQGHAFGAPGRPAMAGLVQEARAAQRGDALNDRGSTAP